LRSEYLCFVVELALIEACENDLSTLFGEGARHVKAQALLAAGHKRNFILQLAHLRFHSQKAFNR
jgi:hypothetical protein